MRDELTVFQNLDNPNRWQGPFRGSPAKWKPADGEAILRALQDAQASPVDRPLGRLAKMITPADRHQSADGIVIVPDDDDTDQAEVTGSAHTEIQHLLVKLGADMGFQYHVAINDHGRTWNGTGSATCRAAESTSPISLTQRLTGSSS